MRAYRKDGPVVKQEPQTETMISIKRLLVIIMAAMIAVSIMPKKVFADGEQLDDQQIEALADDNQETEYDMAEQEPSEMPEAITSASEDPNDDQATISDQAEALASQGPDGLGTNEAFDDTGVVADHLENQGIDDDGSPIEADDDSDPIEADDEYQPYFIDPPTMMPRSRGIDAIDGPPQSISVLVTLAPPGYDVSRISGSVGFHGSGWEHIAEYGFDANYNTVSIVSGYDGNDWLYGVIGDRENNALFSDNSTIHCIDPGMTPPCPNGDNTRQISMEYRGEIVHRNSVYYLYWGFATFHYDPIHAYGGGPQRMGFYVAIPRQYSISVLKLDADSHQVVPNTEFTLYSYPVAVTDGLVTTDTDTIQHNDPAWQEIGRSNTDLNGKLSFKGLSIGYYQIVESRPNPLYKSYAESGGLPCFVLIDRFNSPEIQVFEDEMIQIGVEVYKNTITLTSAAFQTSPNDPAGIDNTGIETYQYDLYFRSTSNVRVDEFVVVDPLENVSAGQVRIVQVFTPVAWGDSDGYFNLWYQTNTTDPTIDYSDANANATNPDNPNNPDKAQVWPSKGWQLWQANIPTTQSISLPVAGLGLGEGEYISALRYEYGSVEVGFTTLNGPLSTQQTAKTAKPAAIDWTPLMTDRFYAEGARAASGLKPASYLVACPEGMLPPTTITSSVSAYIARNIVLTDQDEDDVLTEVIEPFELQVAPFQVEEGISQVTYAKPVNHLPLTGDTIAIYLCASAIILMAIANVLLGLSRRAMRKEAL
ncbi:MAG: hypothetical protein FWH40_02695 [Coriobacteriia bacterium]|nr:hypothetical protein [Coriobacteriia bacterium]